MLNKPTDAEILINLGLRFERIAGHFHRLQPITKDWIVDRLIEAKHEHADGPDHQLAKKIRENWKGFAEA
jgi:hypothetical protein